MTRLDLRPMGVGEVLDRSFQMLRRHLGTLFVTTLLGMAPLLVIYLSMGVPMGAAMPEEQLAGIGGLALVAFFVFMVTVTVAWAALTRQVDQAVEGGPVSLADGARYGVRKFLKVLGLMILVYLAGLGLLLPATLAAVALGLVVSLVLGEAASAVAVAVLIVVAFAVAALVWAPLAFLSLPAMVSEGIGPVQALRRAHRLGKGGRGRVAATAFVAWLVMLLPTIGLPFLFGFGTEFWTGSGAGTTSSMQLYLYQAVTFAVGGLTTPFMVAVMVFTYYDRRVRREGYDVELASEAIPQNV